MISSAVFSMFGGGEKKEKKEEEDRGDTSGSAKAQREAAKEDVSHPLNPSPPEGEVGRDRDCMLTHRRRMPRPSPRTCTSSPSLS